MISSFEVGASLIVQDRASATLIRLADIAERLDKAVAGAAERLAALGKGVSLLRLTEQANGLAGALGNADRAAESIGRLLGASADAGAAALSRLDQATDTAAKTLGAMADQGVAALDRIKAGVAETQAALNGLRGPRIGGFGGGSGGGGGGSGGGGSGGGDESPLRRAVAHRGVGMAADLVLDPVAMAAEFTMYEAFKVGAETQRDRTMAVLSLGADPDSAEGKALEKRIHALGLSSAEGTIYSEKQTAAALPAFLRVTASAFEGTPAEKFKQAETVFPAALRMAEVGEQMRLGSLTSNLEAAAFYAHMTRRYDAAGLDTGLNALLTASEMTGVAPSKLVSIMKYDVPVGNLAGINPDTMTAATAFLVQSMGSSTTAGSALGQIVLGTLSSGGSLSGHLDATRRTLSRDLNLDPESRAALADTNKHDAALREMGIVDGAGKRMVLDSQGNLDLMKELGLIWKFVVANAGDKTKVADAFKYGFGIRGERGLAPFSTEEGQQQWARMEMGFPEAAATMTAIFQQGRVAETPLQEMEQFTAALSNVFNELAQGPLKALGDAAKAAADGLNGVATWFQQHPKAAGLAGDTATGGGAGALAGGIIGSIIPGVGTVTGLVIGGAIGGLGGMIYGETQNGGEPHSLGKFQTPINPYAPGYKSPPERTETTSDPNIHRESFTVGGGGGASVQIGTLTINGAPTDADDKWVQRIMRKVTESMDRALMLNSGPGWGSHSSPYTNAIAI